ncbi:hypothetical protein ACFL0D_04830 [Thermoproteota archaeon]
MEDYIEQRMQRKRLKKSIHMIMEGLIGKKHGVRTATRWFRTFLSKISRVN